MNEWDLGWFWIEIPVGVWILFNALALGLDTYLIGKRGRDWWLLRADIRRNEFSSLAERHLIKRALITARFVLYRRTLRIFFFLTGLTLGVTRVIILNAESPYWGMWWVRSYVWVLIGMVCLIFASEMLEEVQERRSRHEIERQLNDEQTAFD